ncbi:MAG TPA: hypothetical protein VGG82_07855 [Casimicrobiaceae bacterium]|jgi:predicted transcriptional regulator
MTSSKWTVLDLVVAHGVVVARDLADEMDRDHRFVVRDLIELKHDGLVWRDRDGGWHPRKKARVLR